MKPFRKNVAIAIDGGGIRGIIVTKALSILEESLGRPLAEVFHMAAGTSTGSIISTGIASGLPAQRLHELYLQLGNQVFPKTLRKALFPLTRYRYPGEPLHAALEASFGSAVMGDYWNRPKPFDLVITTFDLSTNHTRFIKSWKEEYAAWPVVTAVQGSSTVPTYFPVVEGRYIDGGVGAYANPSYLAAYEAKFVLEWDPAETTLISLGTGRGPYAFNPEQAEDLWAWQWLTPILGAFLQSADDQQVQLVETFFTEMDFRRFNVQLRENIEMDDTSKMPELELYGVEMGQMILNDQTDPAQYVIPKKPA